MPRLTSYTHEGLRFDVRDHGPEDGPVVVLLHGFPERASCWDEVVPALHAAGYRTLAPDQRGYSPGARPRGRRAYAVPRLVADVEALREAAVAHGADAGRVHLVGHDWGAAVAWAYAGRHADRLHTLSAVSVGHTAAFLRSWLGKQLLRSWYMFLFQLPGLPERLARRRGGAFDRLLARSGMTGAELDRFRAEIVDDGALTPAIGWYRGMPFAPPGWTRAVVAVPTVLVWSDGDAAVGRASAEGTARWVRGPYRFHVLEGVSHWIPRQAPERLAGAAARGVRGRPRGGGVTDARGGGPTRRRAATTEQGQDRDRSRPPAPEPLPHPVVDNHCHLDIADGRVGAWLETTEALAAAAAVNVPRIVQIGCDLPGARWAVEAAAAHDALVAGVALHPNEAPRQAEAGTLDEAMAEIERLAVAHDKVRAVGETGLDHYRTGEDGRSAQVESFRRHVELARRLDKTLVIHDRDAHAEVLEVVDGEGPPERWVMHCFSGDAAFARQCLDRGAYLSFAGTVTFKNAQPLRDALAVVPRDRLLVETDAPFLTPSPYRGRPNASYLVPHTVRAMADVRGDDLAELCAAVDANTEAAFGGAW